MLSTALCEWCAQIPLHKLPSGAAALIKFDLGPGSRVKGSPCPLCQLVVEAHYQKDAEVLDEESVELTWREGAELGFAFRVPKAGQDVWIGFGFLESSQDAVCEMRAAHPRRCLLQPTTGSLIDTSRILDWVYSCEQTHGDLCQLPTEVPFAEAFRGLPFIRLIDVQDGCLVEKQHLVKYMALSYVWGAVDNFRLTKANRPALLEKKSLSKVLSRLPKTIDDAITVVQRLGCRYLWVDALCLMQNDANDVNQGVGVMDLIYERAWLTIVAACGHDANARLPGVQEGTRKPSINTRRVGLGIAMGVVVLLDDILGHSVHDSRGWTFQERLLSRRAIYFVEDKLFYRCREAVHAEHMVDLPRPVRAPKWMMPMLPRAIMMNVPVHDYYLILRLYTKRILTNQSDAPRALAGIIQRFSNAMRCQFLEGLPTATFDLFIIFRRLGGSLSRRPELPSYSWTGWSGQTAPDLADTSSFALNGTLEERTWIVWYKRSPSGIVSLVWDPSSEPSFPLNDLTHVGYRQRRHFSHGRYTPAGLDTSRTAPSEAVSFSRDVPPYHILQFWTISAFYTISDIDVFDATGSLVDSTGERCGFVWLDSFEETTYLESQTHFEVILVSVTVFGVDQELKRCSTSSYPNVNGKWKCFNVLLLEWKGGLAERRGFGYLIQEAVANSLAPGPVWREILLA